jgi:hypothetical protein
MADEPRVGDMTPDELKALIRETIVEELRRFGFIAEGEEEIWTKPISELTGVELLLRERRRRELP